MLTKRRIKTLLDMVGPEVEIKSEDASTYTTLRHLSLAEEFAKYGIRLYIGRQKRSNMTERTPKTDKSTKVIYNDEGEFLSFKSLRGIEECLKYLKGGN